MLRIDVGLVVRQYQEGILLAQILDQRAKEAGIPTRERAGRDEVEDLAQGAVLLVVIVGLVTARLQRLYLGGIESEQEEVLRPDLFANLDVGAIEGANRERPIHRELHVARTRALFTRRRNLLRQIRRGDDLLRVRDVVVREVHDLESVCHVAVVIDQRR